MEVGWAPQPDSWRCTEQTPSWWQCPQPSGHKPSEQSVAVMCIHELRLACYGAWLVQYYLQQTASGKLVCFTGVWIRKLRFPSLYLLVPCLLSYSVISPPLFLFMTHKAFSTTLNFAILFVMGTAVAQWLRCCATNRKVAGSIPAGVIGIFHWHKILPIALWPWGRLSL